MQLRLANNVEELNNYLNDEYLQGVLQAQGHSLQALHFEEKSQFINATTNYILVDASRYLLEDFIEGFNVMQVHESIVQHPEQFREVLCKKTSQLDAVMVDLTFEVHLAEEGTNLRPVQERAVVYWRDFLQDCFGKYTNFILT
jgi:hypothetical protein